MNDKPNYYAIITADVRYDNDISANAKLLYAEITALSNQHGYCYASNNYFARLYQVDSRTIRRWIKALEDKEYIEIDLESNNFTNSAEKRRIIIKKRGVDKNVLGYGQKCPGGMDKNVLYNNTSNNSSNNSNIYEIIEKEFGRTISPLEFETIGSWEYPLDILVLAVKEASLSNNLSIKYIDRIIYNWKKANIKSVDDVQRYISEFNERKQMRKGSQPVTQAETKGTDSYEILTL